jgi:uncharacterized repeat protein (TIGR03803 family)
VFFNGTNGSGPDGSLAVGEDGCLYGTTIGGAGNLGTVFRLTTNGNFTTVASFYGTNGAAPQSALVLGNDGNLYGTTASDTSGNGTIFQLRTDGTLTTLVSFQGFNGSHPRRLVQGPDGNFYGETTRGGLTATGEIGVGTIFRLSIPLAPVAPVVQALQQSGTKLNLIWNAVVGQRYQVQYRNDCAEGDWNNWDIATTATNTSITVTDDIRVSPRRFYRVVLLR